MFWAQSIDPQLKIAIYKARNLNGPYELHNDEAPSFHSLAAGMWALLFAALPSLSQKGCTLHPSEVPSRDWLIGILVIAVSGKFLFGSMVDVHKRTYLTTDRSLKRPIAWQLFDVLTAIPGSSLTKLVSKIFWFSFFAVVLFVLERVGFVPDLNGAVIPIYVITACTFLHLGRVAGIYIHSELKPVHAELGVPHRGPWKYPLRVGVLVICGADYLLAYALLEYTLKTCGANFVELPSLVQLVGALALLSLGSAAAGLLGAATAYLFAKES